MSNAEKSKLWTWHIISAGRKLWWRIWTYMIFKRWHSWDSWSSTVMSPRMQTFKCIIVAAVCRILWGKCRCSLSQVANRQSRIEGAWVIENTKCFADRSLYQDSRVKIRKKDGYSSNFPLRFVSWTRALATAARRNAPLIRDLRCLQPETDYACVAVNVTCGTIIL